MEVGPVVRFFVFLLSTVAVAVVALVLGMVDTLQKLDLDAMKIGRKILVLGDKISASIFEGNKNVDISVTKTNAGGLVLNLDGEALGIALLNDTANFASIKTIAEALKGIGSVLPKN